MKKISVAAANKLVRELNAQLDFIYSKQDRNKSYYEVPGETPIQPDYKFDDTQEEISALHVKIANLKHAINLFNMQYELETSSGVYTVDRVLVLLAAKNKQLAILNNMRGMQQKKLDTGSPFSNRGQLQYLVANYNITDAEKKYEELFSEITEMQILLDTANNNQLIEVDL